MSDLTARRAAARKRILENSEERLRRITGVPKQENTQSLSLADLGAEVSLGDGIAPNLSGGDISLHGDLSSSKSVGEETPDCVPENSFPSSRIEGPSNETEAELSFGDTLSELNLNVRSSSKHSIFNTIITNRLHIIFLAVLVWLFSSFGFSLFGESIFTPLFAIEVVEFFHPGGYGSDNSDSQLTSSLLLAGASPQAVAVLRKVLNTILTFLDDFNFYLFSFAVLHALLGA